MTRTARLLTLVVMLSVASGVVGGALPADASHGFGYANCPLSLGLERLTASPTRYGQKALLAGRMRRDDAADISGLTIIIRRRIVGSNTSTNFATRMTNSGGRFLLGFWPERSARYSARWAGTAACPGRKSGIRTVAVRVKISIGTSNSNPAPGQSFNIRGTVAPNHTGQTVTIKWHRQGVPGWHTSSATLSSVSTYTKQFTFASPGLIRFFARWSKQHPDHETNQTGIISVPI